MSLERLVYMANQIGTYFASQPRQDPVEGIANHLRKFWDPRMRREILAHLDDHGGEGLDPLVLKAVQTLRN
jgi:formate dehydrogenase subunit delta